METSCTLKRACFAFAFLILFSFSAFGQFKTVGYLPSWAGSVSAVQFSKLTHVNYAFVLPTNTGGLQALENPSKLQSLVSTAHANGVKVLIAVGGWNNGNDNAFESLAANATYRTNFVNSMINMVNQYGLDGVDIDWEYPDNGASSNNYSLLMQQLSTAMHSRGKLLTAAVVAVGGSSIQNNIFGYVDFLNIMAYDGGGSNHSTYSYAQQSISYWKGRGCPASKVILGLPFYGRSSSEYVGYAALLSRGANPNSDFFGSIGYNGIPTIKAKTNLAFDQGCGGAMIWDLSEDVTNANSLLSAINQVVVERGNPTPNPVAPIGKVITLRGNNSQYVSGENGTQALRCNRPSPQTWEQFSVIDAGGGKVALRSMGKYVSSENGTQAITCTRTTIGDWEKFDWIINTGGTISLRGNNGLYISSENGVAAMTCNRTSIQGWEVFTYAVVGNARMATDETSQTSLQEDDAVFPNPSKGNLSIRVHEPSQVRIVEIHKGNFVFDQPVKDEVTVSNLQPGFYAVIISGRQRKITKVIVQ
ncbi:glycosyl hydrolase family 18 protein [Pseudochryseolinea flava]|uniref:chitinase n=1 Tax=Pseudochryseolinea flava TaxID=2059302 RepID=A0A364XYW3_9BACT|nr:glycosyl hydrolase family 18 protein [Pseudochryseolinea flava]RAV99470.1 glycoside hydrolase [Pseudochryseolinea flava]